jgi:hypothetical protein
MSMTPNQQEEGDPQQPAQHANGMPTQQEVSSFQAQFALQPPTDASSIYVSNSNAVPVGYDGSYANTAAQQLLMANAVPPAASYAPLLFPFFTSQLLNGQPSTASSFSQPALAQLMMLQGVCVGGEVVGQTSAPFAGATPAFMQAALGAAVVSGVPSSSSATSVASSNLLLPPAAAVANTAGHPEEAAASSIPYRCIGLYIEQDDNNLSPYQCLVREQIDLFEATEADIQRSAQGRNRAIVLRQVGIRCRHCGKLPSKKRARGAVFFPSQLIGLYQTAQNLANSHLVKDCFEIPKATREDLLRIRQKELGGKTRKSAYGGGRHYWASCLRVLGVVETADRRLKFRS